MGAAVGDTAAVSSRTASPMNAGDMRNMDTAWTTTLTSGMDSLTKRLAEDAAVGVAAATLIGSWAAMAVMNLANTMTFILTTMKITAGMAEAVEWVTTSMEA